MAKPIVDGIERRMIGKTTVVRLDVTSAVGRQAAGQFRVRAVPTVIVVDGDGQVVLTQAGRVKAAEVEAKVNELLTERESID